MSMRRVCMALALVAVMPLGARAEPISVNLESSSDAEYTGGATTEWFVVEMGDLTLSGSDSGRMSSSTTTVRIPPPSWPA